MHKILGITALSVLLLASACDSPAGPQPTAPRQPSSDLFEPTNPTVGDCSETNPCDHEELPPSGTSPSGLIVANTAPAECANTLPDRDQDGFNDDCEYRLARAFAPQLRFTSGDGDVSREEYWAVQYKPNAWPKSSISIIYLLGYHTDGGHPFEGPLSPAPWISTDHVGDAEFVIVELTAMYGGNFWNAHKAFTSAHWGSQWDRSAWHQYYDIQYADTAGGRPRLYVAKDKHASYNSAASCNQHGDICGPSHFTGSPRVLPERNVGSSHHPMLNNVRSEFPSIYPGEEWFWSPVNFRGWTGRSGDSAGSYRSVLKYWENSAANL